MLQAKETIVSFREISLEEVKALIKGAEIESIIGHEGTARVFSTLLGVELKPNRVFYKMTEKSHLIVGSLNQRLPEGRVLSESELKTIPIKWFEIKIKP